MLLSLRSLWEIPSEFVPPFTIPQDDTKSIPAYEHSALDTPGIATSVANTATALVATFTCTRRTLFLGYIYSGSGQGQFYVTINGGTPQYWRRILYPKSEGELILPNPVLVEHGWVINVYAVNNSGDVQDYESQILAR